MTRFLRLLAVTALVLMPVLMTGARKPKKIKGLTTSSVAEVIARPGDEAVQLQGATVVAVCNRGFAVSDGTDIIMVTRQEILAPGDIVTVSGVTDRFEGMPVIKADDVTLHSSGNPLPEFEYTDISSINEHPGKAVPVKVAGMLESRVRAKGEDSAELFYVYVPDAMKKTPVARVRLFYPDWNALTDLMSTAVTIKGVLIGNDSGDVKQYCVMISTIEPAEAGKVLTVSALTMLPVGASFQIVGTVTSVARRVMTLSDFTGSIQIPVPDQANIGRGMRVSVQASIGNNSLMDPKYKMLRGMSFSGERAITLISGGKEYKGAMKPVPGGYVLRSVKLTAGDKVIFPDSRGFRGGNMVASIPSPLHGGSVTINTGQDGVYDLWYFPEPEVGAFVPAGKKAVPVALQAVEARPEPLVTEPLFKGKGMDEFKSWLLGVTRFPKEHRADAHGSVVTLAATVLPDGSLDDVHIVDSPSPAFSREALRAARKSPSWTPATSDGVPVQKEIIFPVVFNQ